MTTDHQKRKKRRLHCFLTTLNNRQNIIKQIIFANDFENCCPGGLNRSVRFDSVLNSSKKIVKRPLPVHRISGQSLVMN